MRQNVSDQAPKVVQSITDISSASADAQKELADTIEFQRKIIDKLHAELKPLEEQFRKLNMGTSDPKVMAARKEASQAFRELKKEIELEEQALVDLEKQQSSYNNKSQQLRTQLMNVRDEMARLKLAGKEESAQYKELESKLESLGTAYNEVQRQQKALTTGGTQMAGVLSGLSAVSGVISAGVGAFGLFNDKSEKMVEIQTKLQSLIAITVGLQQVSNTLHSTSAFRITTLRKVKELWAAANIKVATTLGITNTQAQILTATLTMGLSLAITAVVAGLSALVSKSRAAANEQREMNKAISDGAAKAIADFSLLQKSYAQLGDDMQAKKKFIADNKKEFDKLGVSVNSVNDAGLLFNSQTEAFKSALMERAKAAAAYDVAVEKFKLAYQKELEAKNTLPQRTDIYTPEGVISTYSNKKSDKLSAESKKLWKDAENLLIQSSEASAKAQGIITGLGLDVPEKIIAGTKAYWEEQRKDAMQVMAAIKDVEIGSKAWNAAVEKYRQATAKLQQWDIKGGDADTEKREKAALAAAKRLSAMSLSIENEINAATSAAVEDNLSRSLAMLEASYDKRKAIIKKREQEIAEIEKVTGQRATKERESLQQLSDAELQKYTAEKHRAIKASQDVVKEIWADVDSKFRSSLDNQLAQMEVYYDKQLEQLRNNLTDQQQYQSAAKELETKRQHERQMIVMQSQLEMLAFEEQIAQRKQELRNDEELFESDKQKNLLEIQRKYAQQRVDLLLAMQAAGVPDLQDDIQAATIALAQLDDQASKLNTSKLREVGNYVKQLASGLSQVFDGVSDGLSKAFAAVGNNVDNMITVLSKTATKGDKITAGIDGMLQIAGMITSQIAENKREQEAWTAAIVESAHQMSLLRIEADAYRAVNLFGVENPYARAIAGAKQYETAMLELRAAAQELEEGQVQVGTKKGVAPGNIYAGFGAGASVGAAVGSIVPVIGTVVGAAVGSVVGAIAGLFTRKRYPIFETLKKQYGEIYNSETFELNPKILADYAKLDDATKKLVDNWQEIKDKALEAQEAMRQTFSDLAGDIGSQLSDSLVNAFRDGDIYKGIDDFKSYMDKTIEDIVSQLIFSAHFQNLFNDLEKRFNDSFKEGGDGSIVDDLIWFSQQYKSGVDAFAQNLEAAKEELKKQGIDIYTLERSRTGATKGIAQASQESINELSGGIYGMRLTLADIRSVAKEQLVMMKAYKVVFDRIADNTDYCRYLLQVKEALEDMNSRGITIRK